MLLRHLEEEEDRSLKGTLLRQTLTQQTNAKCWPWEKTNISKHQIYWNGSIIKYTSIKTPSSFIVLFPPDSFAIAPNSKFLSAFISEDHTYIYPPYPILPTSCQLLHTETWYIPVSTSPASTFRGTSAKYVVYVTYSVLSELSAMYGSVYLFHCTWRRGGGCIPEVSIGRGLTGYLGRHSWPGRLIWIGMKWIELISQARCGVSSFFLSYPKDKLYWTRRIKRSPVANYPSNLHIHLIDLQKICQHNMRDKYTPYMRDKLTTSILNLKREGGT